MATQASSPVCIIPTGHPAITVPTSIPNATSFVFTLPPPTQQGIQGNSRPYNHITVFLLPGVELPPDTAAAVYISLSSGEFRFLGGIGSGKESAVFKITGLKSNNGGAGNGTGERGGEEVDMDAPEQTPSGEITLGISLETAASVSAQVATLQQQQQQVQAQSATQSQALATANTSGSGVALMSPAQKQQITIVLAQKIIKNAFNFLASFSGNLEGGVEVVPLKAFEEWWKKFEGRVRADPGFLERESE